MEHQHCLVYFVNAVHFVLYAVLLSIQYMWFFCHYMPVVLLSLYAVLLSLYAVLLSLYAVLLSLYAVLFSIYAVLLSLYAVLLSLYAVLLSLYVSGTLVIICFQTLYMWYFLSDGTYKLP